MLFKAAAVSAAGDVSKLSTVWTMVLELETGDRACTTFRMRDWAEQSLQGKKSQLKSMSGRLKKKAVTKRFDKQAIEECGEEYY